MPQPAGVTVRPMVEADVEAVDACAHRAFDALYTPLGHPPQDRDEARVRAAHARVRHLVRTDPEGCWTAEAGGAVAGAALALRRDDFWGLSLLVVDPDRQAAGTGRALLGAALGTAQGARGMILASLDPRAVRLYSQAGFRLHPAMRAAGAVRRSALPPTPEVREGSAADLVHTVTVDLAVRGAAHGADLALLIAHGGRLFVTPGGYAVLRGDDVALLAATGDGPAEALLWRCLAEAGGDAEVNWLTAEQGWAVRVALAAGLRVEPGGPLFLRGLDPPGWYLPNGAWL